MSHEQVCSWLGLPPGSWPPDHYTLLGLERGEADLARIEQRIHERLVQLRSRQLHDPEQVTEAMNLLARAFTCLTDPDAKRIYDAQLLGQALPETPGSAGKEPAPRGETPAKPIDPLAWLYGPWSQGRADEPNSPGPPATARNWETAPPPARVDVVPPAIPPTTAEVVESNGAPASPAAPAATDKPAEPGAAFSRADDYLTRAARSARARRGLGTKRALYHRLARTRQLLRAWEGAGKYLVNPYRRISRSGDVADLIRKLNTIRRLLRRFPPLLGDAGQSGFYVITLAQQPRHALVPTFRMLLPSQRETLARDWRDGHKLLLAHRDFLRRELHALRKTSRLGRLVRAIESELTEHPSWLVLGAIIVALAVVAWLSFHH
jgi:hypothetical protein